MRLTTQWSRGSLFRKLCATSKSVIDLAMYKIGSLSFELSHRVDASHSGTTMFCPAFEYMSLGFTHPSVTKPIFWYSSML